ncbi:MAG: hypothetical protein C3F11_11060 [Methylocystaceae bacterium]|nr:MAG: hypothetical protein C3F11_11060 [Methylocystaceae bacterium]
MIRAARCALLALAFGLGACAERTRDIPAAVVDPSPFIGPTCSQLVAARAARSRALIFSGLAQDQTSEDDATRTIGVPTPMGTIFGRDREAEIARLKGELRALNAQMSEMNCGPDYR